MRICDQDFTNELIARIQATVDADPAISRRKLSLQVCQWLDWRSPNGKLKEMSCRVALLKLHRQGLLKLPAAGPTPPKPVRPQARNDNAEALPPIECKLSELGRIELVAIKSPASKESHIWNDLMARYHYLGAGPLCGAQMRYLIKSERAGYLGGLAFSAAAWRVAARDRWIGWDEATRRKHLNRIVNNSRFLIAPQVKVKNLASHVLAQAVKRLRGDWLAKYAIEPVLVETFVEPGRFKGTSYRAANWRWVGLTKGRGRQDRTNEYAVPVKALYLYPLRKDAVALLGGGPTRAVAAAAKSGDWAEEELSVADLGDRRRVKRLMTIARDFYARPQANIPQACQSRVKSKAAYRFFDGRTNTLARILAPHYAATVNRLAQEPVVLAVQDTTTLNYSAHPATEGLGPISNQAKGVVGLLMHDTMAFNTARTPLGLLDVQCWARDPAAFGKKQQRYELPIEQKESNKWLKSYAAVRLAAQHCPATLFVCVGDREADIYEFFQRVAEDPHGPAVLVRAAQDRVLAEGLGHVWDYVKGQALGGSLRIQIPRRGNCPAREAEVELRFACVRLKPPQRKPGGAELTLWAIVAEEVNYSATVEEPLQWLLLTTREVTTFAEAVEKLDWYSCRWGIEVYHRTLKSGCKIEERQLGSADRIEACLAIDLVVAWRIYHLTKLGREVPDVPCTIYFEEAEWQALVAYKTQNSNPPVQPPSLREATRMIASLGGFLGRNSDGEPGTKSLWLGLQRLDDLTAMWKITMSKSALTTRHPLYPVMECG
jgi:hypothetical protein